MASRRVASLLRRFAITSASRHPAPIHSQSPLPFLLLPLPSATAESPSSAHLGLSLPNPLFSSRLFSSASGPSNIVLIQSGDQLTDALKKAQDDKVPAIFYFTAVWCGPCRVIAPFIEEMSHKFLHVTTYKVDIDQEGLGSILSSLQIHSVPTFQFFHNGKKATEVVGADKKQLEETFKSLYKQE
ncbi:thioredoxin O, mitochondrial-like [Zingiber officinale]|uniref:thioredoxin O, mitochondrial-like n=1 Tax=Zingiber officinale TaxID=94328 RepID=UPI001C4AE8A0|nr:thioredoxin O, mitochondrial-like [Zingiber officinale]